jgi:hypothetical protein
MGLYTFGDEEDEIPEAYIRRFGNARIPSSADCRAWKEGRLGGDPHSWQFDIHGKRIIDRLPSLPRDQHPVTHRWTPFWKPRPTGEGKIANRRTRFKLGDPRAILAGRRSTPAKRMAARENGRLGGRPRKQSVPRPKPEGAR